MKMMIRPLAIAAFLGGLIGLFGSAATVASPMFDDGEAATEQATEKTLATPEFTLLEAGSSPRKELRYAYTAGEKRTYELRKQMTLQHRTDGTPESPEQSTPVMILGVDFHIDEVDEDGKATGRFVFADLNIDEDVRGDFVARRQVMHLLGTLRGNVIHVVLCDRGMVHKLEAEEIAVGDFWLAQMLDDMRISLTQLLVPVPEQAVGPGGRWKVDAQIEIGAYTLQETSTYELVRSDDDDGFAVKTRIERDAKPGSITDPLSGQKFELKRMKTELQGVTTLAWHAALPVDAEMSGTTRAAVATDMSHVGQGTQMTERRLTVQSSIRDTTDDVQEDEAEEPRDVDNED